LIQSIRPDVLVKGDDWALEEIVGAQFVLSYGGEVVRVPRLPDVSTTRILAQRARSN
jgi:bifunctional ADP-heptose synthase (sugar kinase/adenylyltransferase)